MLPLGAFKGGGDYSEGDIEREPTPKMSLGAGYSYNRQTMRSGGQMGAELFAPVDLGTFITDAMVKYQGWAYQAEYMRRTSPNPFTFSPTNELRYAYVGQGLNQQLSYFFLSGWEPALRYSWLRPDQVLRNQAIQQEVLEVGLTKYLRRHRVKAQLNASYQPARGNWQLDAPGNRWGGVFQFELGI